VTIPNLDRLPPEYRDAGLLAEIQRTIRDDGRKLVVLDDDPTGVQTVHDVAVLTRWSPEAIARELRSSAPAFFILTNSRSLPAREAAALNRSIAEAIGEAADRANVGYVLVSRGDSTLRGHFPQETDALATALGAIDGVVLCPAFIEGGRVTIEGIHYLREGERLIPVAETEFARDQVFGYRSSSLPDWVEEKTGGRMAASDVNIITLADLRAGGPDRVGSLLAGVTGGQVIAFDAVSYHDLEVAALGILRAEMRGKRFIYRCGASLVRVRAGIAERPLLSRTELLGQDASGSARGLVIVGSHVHRTTEQLAHVLALPMVAGVEVSVADVLDSDRSRARAVASAGASVDDALRRGLTPVVSTSRAVVSDAGGRHLETGKRVSAALVEIVRRLSERPGYIIAKGGITSSDVGTAGLGVERAMVIGQAGAGIPVWRLGPETRFPGMPYIVFPGNVGEAATLASLVIELDG